MSSISNSTDRQRHKVLFVASSLLEKYPSTAEGHSYVTDFLAVVSPLRYASLVAIADIDSIPVSTKNSTRHF